MVLLRTVVEGLGPASSLLFLGDMDRPANSSNSNWNATSKAPNSNRTTTESIR